MSAHEDPDQPTRLVSHGWVRRYTIEGDHSYDHALTHTTLTLKAGARLVPEPRIAALLAALRVAFEQRLITEVQEHGGIPALPPEEIELRDAIAALLQAAETLP